MNDGIDTKAVWLVTGAGQGIGEAIARRAAALGHDVVVADCNLERAAVIASAVRAAGGSASELRIDVSDASSVETGFTWTERMRGPIQVLVNVAGVLRTGPTVSFDEADFEHLFSVNTTGVFLASRAAARRMLPRRAGCIVTVASNSAGVPRANMAAYAASKAAAAHLTKCLGLELAPHGIRCNVVSPGSTDTPMLRAMHPDWCEQRFVAGSPELFKVGIPLGKLAKPDDVAQAVLFLASSAGGHITMQELYVDGGATLRT